MSISIYNENGKTFYEVFVKGRDQSGKQIARRKRKITSEVRAKKIEFEFKKILEAHINQDPIWTWGSWLAECVKRMKLSLKVGTVLHYEGGITKWMPKDWHSKELKSFTKSDIHDALYSELMDSATEYIRKNTHKRVRRIFELAVEEGLLTKNPAKGISIKVPEAKQLVLNSNEAQKLLNIAKQLSHRFYDVWVFALLTGMRSGEMYSLVWSDIDLETNLIYVTRQWTSKDGLHPTKSGRNRIVPISPELRHFLVELKLRGGHTETLWDGVSKQNVTIDNFALPRLKEWNYGEQAEVLRDFCGTINLPRVKFHDLRATFITNMLAQGVSLAAVMSIVGHNRLSTTDRYLRLAGVGVAGTTEKLSYAPPKGEIKNVKQLHPVS